MKRIQTQRDLAQKMITGSWEIDYAINRHKRMQEEDKAEKQRIMDNKLKPKGHLLIKKK